MISIHLKDEVSRAIDSEWTRFADEHPRLASVIDRQILIDEAAAALAEDPEYREAMQQAALAGIAFEAAGQIVRKFVTGWLRRLM
jgi:hypothetical protein